MAGHMIDNTGALVEVPPPRRVADWRLDGHWGWHNSASVTILTKTWEGRTGHQYLVTGAINGFGPLFNVAKPRTYWVKINGTTVQSHLIGVTVNGSYGNRLAQQVIPLLALHTAQADGTVTLTVGMDRSDVSEQDWELMESIHTCDVLDLGALA